MINKVEDVMKYEEKFTIITKAIDEARKITPPGYDTKLKITSENKLQNLDLDDIASILYQLQDNHKVIKIVSLANTSHLTGLDSFGLDPYEHEEERNYFVLKVLDIFEKWSKQYSNTQQIKESSDTTINPKYTRKALEKIWDILQEIEEKRQLLGSDDDPIRLPCYLSGSIDNEQYEIKRSILGKLSCLDAIIQLHKGTTNRKEGNYLYWSFYIGDKYFEIFSEYEEEYKKIAKAYQQSKQMEEVKIKNPVYKITYSDKTRKILVNNFLLAKPDFFRENEVVFTYVYNNPNRRISLEEIKEKTRYKITKSLPKILENLGFTGQLRKAFFDVSSKGIRLRNPVTKKDLKELGIKNLSLS